MSVLEDCQSKEITQLRGFATLPDEYDRAGWADVARNCEFLLNSEVRTRRGFGTVFPPVGLNGALAIRNWIRQGVSLIVYIDSNAQWAFSLTSGFSPAAGTFGGETLDFADIVDYGPYVIMCRGNATLATVAQAQIMQPDENLGFGHRAFSPPYIGGNYSVSEPNAGTVSAGEHFFAIVFTTTSGYETRPSPVNAVFPSSGTIADLMQFSFVATGGKTLQVIFNPNGATAWYQEYVSAALLMTTTINPSRYFFVPGCVAPVNGGSLTSIVFPEINLSDLLLAATASKEAVTADLNYFGLYSQDHAFAGPFSPFKTLAYSNRAVYFTVLEDGTSACFISEQNAREWITLAFHLVQLPDRRRIVTGFVLRGSLYLVGPNWTYAISDNNAQPVSWAPAQEVDGRIGTQAARGVDANSSLGYAWVAHTTGLYLFTQGFYAARPVTYLIQSIWNRINWQAAKSVIVKDFPDRKMVFVFVPLDGSTNAAYQIAIDYTNGTNWDQVNCSLWSIFGGNKVQQFGTPIGAAELVLNAATNITELWLSTIVGGDPFYRSKSEAAGDLDLYSDGAEGGPLGRFGIPWEYRSCALPQVFREPQNYVAVAARVRGSNGGSLGVVASTLDHKYTQDLSPIVTEVSPGEWSFNLMDIQNETVHVEVDNYNAEGGAQPGVFGIIAGWKVWFTKWLAQR